MNRGFTYTEQYRHECEVRYVMAMPSREQRRDYIESLVRKRGEAAAKRLRDDVQAAWFGRGRTPAPSVAEGAGAARPAVHHAVNDAGDGSLLALPNAGSSGPVHCVDSGVAAR